MAESVTATGWQLAGHTARWDGGGLRGEVVGEKGKSLGARIEVGGSVRITWGAIRFRAVGGSEESTLPTVAGLHVQQPYLVVLHEVTSSVGLRLVVQLLAEPGAITMDLRLETVAPLDQVSFAMNLECAELSLRPEEAYWPRTGNEFTRREFHRAELRGGAGVAAGFVTDLGEQGRGVLRDEGKRAELVMFDQPLEKGVVLIGRWGIVRRPPEMSAATFRQMETEWLGRRTFL